MLCTADPSYCYPLRFQSVHCSANASLYASTPMLCASVPWLYDSSPSRSYALQSFSTAMSKLLFAFPLRRFSSPFLCDDSLFPCCSHPALPFHRYSSHFLRRPCQCLSFPLPVTAYLLRRSYFLCHSTLRFALAPLLATTVNHSLP